MKNCWKYFLIVSVLILLNISTAYSAKISELPEDTDVSGLDWTVVVDPAYAATSKITLENFLSGAQKSKGVYYSNGNIAAAVAAIGTTKCDLMFDTSETLSANLDLSALPNINMKWVKGAVMTLNNVTFTDNGQTGDVPYQVFSCTGTGAVAGMSKVNPDMFGAAADAVAGSTTATDDTLKIISAVSSLKTGGCLELLAGKRYGIKRQSTEAVIVQVKSNMTVCGSGALQVLIANTNDNYWRAIGAATAGGAVDNVVIRDIEIDGGNTRTAYSGDYEHNGGVFFYNSTAALTNITIDNVYAHDFSGDAISLATGVDGGIIKNCRYKDALRQGIYLGYTAKNVLIDGNINLTNDAGLTIGGNGIHFEGTGGRTNITVVNNIVYNGMSMSNTTGLTTDNNKVLTGDIVLNYCSNTIIGSDILFTGRIEGTYLGTNVTIQGTKILAATATGIALTTTAVATDHDLKIAGVEITATGTDVVGISVQNIKRFSIRGCDIKSESTGIYTRNADSGIIANNTVESTAASAISISGGTSGQLHYRGVISVMGNQIIGHGTGSFYDLVTSGIRVVSLGNYTDDGTAFAASFGTNTQHWPYSAGAGMLLRSSALPTYGVWAVGDRWEATDNSGTVARCTTAGGGTSGAWSAEGTYLKGDFVTGSDSKVYEALVAGGEAENPTTDADNTYWILRADQAVAWT